MCAAAGGVRTTVESVSDLTVIDSLVLSSDEMELLDIQVESNDLGDTDGQWLVGWSLVNLITSDVLC